MVFNKHKKISILLISLVFAITAVFSGVIVLRPQTAHAATPAQCFLKLATAPVPCSSAAPGTIQGGSFQPDQCYTGSVSSGSTQVSWVIADCSQLPFNTSGASALCNDGKMHTSPGINGHSITPEEVCAPYGGVSGTSPKIDCNAKNLDRSNCGIINWIVIIINVLSGFVGLVLVVSLMVAGIQWTTAGDNPQQVSAAKTRIVNVVIAALVFIFMFAFLQWLIPGGIF